MTYICEDRTDYLAVVRRYNHYTDVLNFYDNTVWRLSNEAFKYSAHVPLFEGLEPQDLTGRTLNYRQYIKEGKPRVYIGVIHEGKRNRRVILPDFNELMVPNDEWDQWHGMGDYEYCLTMDRLQYPNGRQLEDLTFGIEFEFTGLADSKAKQKFVNEMKCLLGDRFDEEASPGPKYWTIGHDSSIRSKGGYYGYELQTPILHFRESDYRELCHVLNLVKKYLYGSVNSSCGTHVHFGNFIECCRDYECICDDDRLKNEYMDKFKALSLCYGRLERTVFDRLVERSRRLDNNEYCESCAVWKDERYRKINLCCYPDNGSLENRHHHGTLDAEDIWHWMEVVGRFVLKYYENDGDFEQVDDLASFFEIIGLEDETRRYYSEVVESMRREIRKQIENMMQKADYRSDENKEDEVPDEICLGHIGMNHVRACA